jgi:hypothetical protein
MTWALCFNCGNIKFGALCPCSECGVSTCGNTDLDILFSDHHLARRCLEELGSVIKVLCRVTDDRELRFAAFLCYMTQHHPQFLEVRFTPEGESKINALLDGLDLPEVTIHTARGGEGWSSPGRNGADLPEPELPGGNGSGEPNC